MATKKVVRATTGSLRPTTVLEIATASQRGKAPRKLAHPEAVEQRMFVKRWRMDPRTRDLPASAIPSGGNRSAKEGALMKADGLERGLPDWMLWARGHFIDDGLSVGQRVGLALEFKRPGAGRISPEQKAWHDALRENGWQVAVVDSARDAWAIVTDYLGMKP
jgi:hypothetical protein